LTPTFLDPTVLGGVAFVLGLAAGILGPRFLRGGNVQSEAPAKGGKRKLSKAPPRLEEEAPTIQKVSWGSIEHSEPADLTKMAVTPPLLKREQLPNIAADESEDEAEGTPSVSLVSYIDQLDPHNAPKEPLQVVAAGKRDVGKKRRRNEDRYVIVNDDNVHRHLFAVVDGMGDHGGGAVASRLTSEILSGRLGSSDKPGSKSDKRPSDANALVWAIEHANRVVWETSQETAQLEGMGSTVVAAVYDPEKRCIYIAYVGDSRAYRLRKGRCELLTSDHTLAPDGPMASYLRRAVGVRDHVKVDVVVGYAEAGDTYLLCTDGVSKMKTEKEIATILAENDDPQNAVDALIAGANAAGGMDNMAVVVFRVDRRMKRHSSPSSVNFRSR
jgi:protein phosphatase